MIKTHENGMKEIIFGTGNIMMNDTKPKGGEFFNGLAFKQVAEPQEIGSLTQRFQGISLNEFDPEVHFVFNKKESVKAVIDSLTLIYDQMPDEQKVSD